jgi:hypothetical protein
MEQDGEGGSASFDDFASQFYPAVRARGMIIDVRRNAGGNIDTWILERLLRAAWLFNAERSGAFYLTLVPIRPRSRGERRSLRTLLPGASLRPGSLAYSTATPFNSASDAFQLHPDIIARTDPRPSGPPDVTMQYAFSGEVVVLVDERTSSDAEIFALAARRLGVGTVIGQRTWGGAVGYSGDAELALVDGSGAF